MCMCDQPTCDNFPCKALREYRIAHAVITAVVERRKAAVIAGEAERCVELSAQDVLDELEFECEILCK